MIPVVLLPAKDRPGFCQACYCEQCGKGFYEKARGAIVFSTDRISCSERGCSGEVRNSPLLLWRRMRECRKCGARP